MEDWLERLLEALEGQIRVEWPSESQNNARRVLDFSRREMWSVARNFCNGLLTSSNPPDVKNWAQRVSALTESFVLVATAKSDLEIQTGIVALESARSLVEEALRRFPDNRRASLLQLEIRAKHAEKRISDLHRAAQKELDKIQATVGSAEKKELQKKLWAVWRMTEEIKRLSELEDVTQHRRRIETFAKLRDLVPEPPPIVSPGPPVPSEAELLHQQLKTQIESMDDRELWNLVAESLQSICVAAGHDLMLVINKLRAFALSFQELLRELEQVQTARAKEWRAQADLAVRLPRPREPLASAFALLAGRCRDSARETGLAHLGTLVSSDLAVLSHEVSRFSDHSAFALERAEIEKRCAPMLQECDRQEKKRLEHWKGAQRLEKARNSLVEVRRVAGQMRREPSLNEAGGLRAEGEVLLREADQLSSSDDSPAIEEVSSRLSSWIQKVESFKGATVKVSLVTAQAAFLNALDRARVLMRRPSFDKIGRDGPALVEVCLRLEALDLSSELSVLETAVEDLSAAILDAERSFAVLVTVLEKTVTEECNAVDAVTSESREFLHAPILEQLDRIRRAVESACRAGDPDAINASLGALKQVRKKINEEIELVLERAQEELRETIQSAQKVVEWGRSAEGAASELVSRLMDAMSDGTRCLSSTSIRVIREQTLEIAKRRLETSAQRSHGALALLDPSTMASLRDVGERLLTDVVRLAQGQDLQQISDASTALETWSARAEISTHQWVEAIHAEILALDERLHHMLELLPPSASTKAEKEIARPLPEKADIEKLTDMQDLSALRDRLSSQLRLLQDEIDTERVKSRREYETVARQLGDRVEKAGTTLTNGQLREHRDLLRESGIKISPADVPPVTIFAETVRLKESLQRLERSLDNAVRSLREVVKQSYAAYEKKHAKNHRVAERNEHYMNGRQKLRSEYAAILAHSDLPELKALKTEIDRLIAAVPFDWAPYLRLVTVGMVMLILVTAVYLSWITWKNWPFDVEVLIWPHGRIAGYVRNGTLVNFPNPEDKPLHKVSLPRGTCTLKIQLDLPSGNTIRRDHPVEAGKISHVRVGLVTFQEFEALLDQAIELDPYLSPKIENNP